MPLTPTRAEERWGAAVAHLSLDVVQPFYEALGVPTDDPAEFARVLRDAILENRRVFEEEPSVIPDLKVRVCVMLSVHFPPPTADAFAHWVENVFAYRAEDVAWFSTWWYVLALSRNRPERWAALGLPASLSEEACARLDKAVDRTELHALADEVEGRPLSEWDTEMYAIHGLYQEGRDPYELTLETIRKRRFLAYLAWLSSALPDADRRAFVERTNALKGTIETVRADAPLEDPKKLLKAHAYDPT